MSKDVRGDLMNNYALSTFTIGSTLAVQILILIFCMQNYNTDIIELVTK